MSYLIQMGGFWTRIKLYVKPRFPLIDKRLQNQFGVGFHKLALILDVNIVLLLLFIFLCLILAIQIYPSSNIFLPLLCFTPQNRINFFIFETLIFRLVMPITWNIVHMRLLVSILFKTSRFIPLVMDNTVWTLCKQKL